MLTDPLVLHRPGRPHPNPLPGGEGANALTPTPSLRQAQGRLGSGQALFEGERGALWREALALGLLAAVVLISFRDALTSGLVAYQRDTELFYYPLQAWFSEELKAGRFPLWNPYIFGGHPIFADGDVGLAYPLQLLLLALLPQPVAFIWLRISSVLIAAASMYALCRALRLGQAAAVLGGITFSLGSFMLSQQHHESVTRTAAWLPLMLACTEWALQSSGGRRIRFLTAAAAALGMAALGVHPQVLAMNLLAFATYVLFRVLVEPGYHVAARLGEPALAQAPHPEPVEGRAGRIAAALGRLLWKRGLLLVAVGAYVTLLGFGLAAAQLLPLIEFGISTVRGSVPDYFYATSYALPMQNLITLVFPYFFRGADSEYWSLWAKWETALYVGIAPLVLGTIGAVCARRREALYFLALAFVALWLAFATYAPIDLYQLVWNLPGFSAFRVPGRYTLLFVLAWSVLAAFGLERLGAATIRPGLSFGRLRMRGLRQDWLANPWGRALPLGVLGLISVGAVGLLLAMDSFRSSLVADPAGSLAWIQASYLSLRNHGQGLTGVQVYEGLLHSVSAATLRTTFAWALLAGTVALAAAALVLRSRFPLWQGALVALAAVDLLAFGAGFHQKRPVGELVQPNQATEFLQGAAVHQQDVAASSDALTLAASTGSGQALSQRERGFSEQWRVFTPGTIPSLEFDRLVPFRIEDIGGYSSLETRRNFEYWWVMRSTQNRLLDLANVRYVVSEANPPSLPSYRGVSFDPGRPLMLGANDALGGAESYRAGGQRADRVRVVASLTRALDIPHGAVVAEVHVTPHEGPPMAVPLRAGIDVAEWAYDRIDVAGRVKHGKPLEIAFRRPDALPTDGSRYELLFFYSEHDLPGPMAVDRIDIVYTYPLGGMELYGVGLYDFGTGQTASLTQAMRSKLRPVYQDREVRIQENTAAFPRAYVVPGARLAPAGMLGLSAMLDTPFDPTREVLLETSPGSWVPGPKPGVSTSGRSSGPSPQSLPPRAAQLLLLETDRVAYRAAAPEGGYFVHVASYGPGWRAWVDGQEAPVLLANGMFRAVPLPPGEHLVELRYGSAALTWGRWLSTLALILLGVVSLVARELGTLFPKFEHASRSGGGLP